MESIVQFAIKHTEEQLQQLFKYEFPKNYTVLPDDISRLNLVHETPTGLFIKALIYFKQGDITNFLQYINRSIDKDCVIAMHFVAKCYWDGKSLTVDRELAIYYYHKSAEQSYIPSARMLGKSYIDGSMTRIDLDNAMFFLKKAWYAGCIDSGMILMSTCMKEKRDYDTVKDICETVIYTPPEKNNEINTIRCKFILCSILFYGLGDIPKNKDEAIRYAKEAAYTIDNAYGHEYLGNIYETMYIQKNREENEYLDLAYKEYKIAAELDGNIFGKNINRFVERYGILDD